MIQLSDAHQLSFTVPAGKGVPDLFPESPLFTALPPVFATGFTVGLMEWCCIDHLRVAEHHTDDDISLGIGINITHDAPCTEGTTLDVTCTCVDVGKKSVTWDVVVKAGDIIMAQGQHKRAIVNREQFTTHVNSIATKVGGRQI